MTSSALVTDGSAVGYALARWITERVPGVRIVEARGGSDVERVLEARSLVRPPERLVALGGTGRLAHVSGVEAGRVVTEWLREAAPYDIRALGPGWIEERRRAAAPGAEVLDELLTSLGPGEGVRIPRSRAGRPPGRDPFRGAGFDVCVGLLLEPDTSWTERLLAERIGRGQPQVHRILVELAQRGLVERGGRGGTGVRDMELLRASLLEAWQRRLGPGPRRARPFLARRRGDPRKALAAAARRAGVRFVLAGPAAASGPDALAGEPVVAYLDGEPALLLEQQFEPAARSGDLVIWSPPEPGVFLAARVLDGFPATNRVVTWLDLAALGTDRAARAAEAAWQAP